MHKKHDTWHFMAQFIKPRKNTQTVRKVSYCEERTEACVKSLSFRTCIKMYYFLHMHKKRDFSGLFFVQTTTF